MIKRYRKTAISQYVIVGLALAALVVLGYLSTLLMKAVTFSDYFALPWAAGRGWLLEGQNPYDPSLRQVAAEAIENAGYSGLLPEDSTFLHPLMNLFFYLPFSLLPFALSRAVWVVCLGILAGLTVHFSLKFSEWALSRFEKIVAITIFIIWMPGITTILTGRFSLIIVFFMVYGLWSIKSGRYRWAGFLMALTAGSLQLSLFILILALLWSIARRQWSFLKAFLSGTAFLFIISFLMFPDWPLSWLRAVLGTYQSLDWIQTPLMGMASVLPGIENFLSIGLHTIAGIFTLALWIRLFGKSTRVFMWNALATLVITNLFQLETSIYGILLLIPPLCLILRFTSERWKLAGKLISWFTLILVSAGPWFIVLPVLPFSGSLSLPLLTIGLPLFVLLGMVWIRWWAVRLTSLPRI